MLNLKQMAVAETADIHLRDAADELMFSDGKPVSITVYSPGTKKFNDAQAEKNSKLMESLKRKGGKKDNTFYDTAEFLASVTVSFNNFEYDTGLTGKELFLACYLDTSIGFVAEQVAKEVYDWSNFLKM